MSPLSVGCRVTLVLLPLGLSSACARPLPGGKGDSGTDAAFAPDFAADSDAASVPGFVLLDTAPACWTTTPAPVLESADAFGSNLRFVAMAKGVVQGTAELDGGYTQVLLRVPNTIYKTPAARVEGLAPNARIQAVERVPQVWPPDGVVPDLEQALFCDATDCRVFVSRNGVFVEDAFPPLPLGDWGELFPAAYPKGLAVRGGGLLCSFDGASWKTDRLDPAYTTTVPACLASEAVLVETGHPRKATTGVNAASQVIVVDSNFGVETCCPLWSGVAGALEIRTFVFGDSPSTWVLTPSTLFGDYRTGHD
jgi:hypothetical protein